MKFDLVIAIFPNLVANDYKSHVVVNGLVTFWLISTSLCFPTFGLVVESIKELGGALLTLQQHKKVVMLCEEGMIIAKARSALLVQHNTKYVAPPKTQSNTGKIDKYCTNCGNM